MASTLVLAGSVAAGTPALASASKVGTALGKVSAGYQASGGGYRLRYVSAMVSLPNPNQALNPHGDTLTSIDPNMSFAVHLADSFQTIVLNLTAGTGDSNDTWTAAVAQEYNPAGPHYAGTPDGSSFTDPNTFASGETVRLDLFYSTTTEQMSFDVYDGAGALVWNGSFSPWTSVSTGGGAFTTAFAGADVLSDAYASLGAGTFSRPATDVRAFQVSSVLITSYSGQKGSILGPWPSQQVELGTSSNNVEANAPVLFSAGHNFAVWLRS